MIKKTTSGYENPSCQYTEGVECKPEQRVCKRCGHNPIVNEIRVMAIKMGEKRFLRYTEDDFDKICLPLRNIQ